jgi:hypothetical protein
LGWVREVGFAGVTLAMLGAPTVEGVAPAAVPAPSTSTAEVEPSTVPRVSPGAPEGASAQLVGGEKGGASGRSERSLPACERR